MYKKQIAVIIMIAVMVIIYLLISSKKANDSISLLEEDVLAVEAFLGNAIVCESRRLLECSLFARSISLLISLSVSLL